VEHRRILFIEFFSSSNSFFRYAHVWNFIEFFLSNSFSSSNSFFRYAHVWNIVAQPDGTFYWLQAECPFINYDL